MIKLELNSEAVNKIKSKTYKLRYVEIKIIFKSELNFEMVKGIEDGFFKN